MEFLFFDWLGTPVWFWMSFVGIVAALTVFDLGILHKEDREMGIAESLKALSLLHQCRHAVWRVGLDRERGGPWP
jgi:hypothetical protein